jgi:uncharacterized protein YbjT (DUF2867 family)
MKIVIIGGTGLIGRQLLNRLHEQGHEVLAASPSRGIDALTGQGLDAALAGAQVVVDVSNSPSFEDRTVMEFFETSTRRLLAAEAAAGVAHHVALSVVGTQRLPDSGYFRAKLAQENLIRQSQQPYSIVQATQFFEFLGAIAQGGTQGDTLRLSTALFQPIASEDVVAALHDIALGAPLNGTLEIAGPESITLADAVSQQLAASGDRRRVIGDAGSGYFGARIDDRSLTPGKAARLGTTRLADWLARSGDAKPA